MISIETFLPSIEDTDTLYFTICDMFCTISYNCEHIISTQKAVKKPLRCPSISIHPGSPAHSSTGGKCFMCNIVFNSHRNPVRQALGLHFSIGKETEASRN